MKQTADVGDEPKQTAAERQHGFLGEKEILALVPVSRRTWGNWKSGGLIPFIKIGRRCLYDWESVRKALLRMEKGGQQ
jgi:hypothetical protein